MAQCKLRPARPVSTSQQGPTTRASPAQAIFLPTGRLAFPFASASPSRLACLAPRRCMAPVHRNHAQASRRKALSLAFQLLLVLHVTKLPSPFSLASPREESSSCLLLHAYMHGYLSAASPFGHAATSSPTACLSHPAHRLQWHACDSPAHASIDSDSSRPGQHAK